MQVIKKISLVSCFLMLSVGFLPAIVHGADTTPDASEPTTSEPIATTPTDSTEATLPTEPLPTEPVAPEPTPTDPLPITPTPDETTTTATTEPPTETTEPTEPTPTPDTDTTTTTEDPNTLAEPSNIDAPPSSHVEPAPPTSSDGVKAVSREGYYLVGIPIRSGFTSQPQAVQYVKFGTDVHLRANLTGININPFAKVKVYVTRWDWTGERWQIYSDPTGYTTTSLGVNRNAVDIVFGPSGRFNPPVGIHYFQLKVTYGLSTYYSALSKIGVSQDDIHATNIVTDVENNINLVGMNYNADAYLDPGDATSTIRWTSNGNLTYDSTEGHNISYTPNDTIIADRVNKDAQAPGFVETLSATAINTDGTLYSYNTPIYVGGLAAIDLPIEKANLTGFSWPVYGLDKLTKEFYGSTSQVVKSASFKWTFYGKNDTGTYAPITLPSDIQNVSGSFSIPDDLNDSKALTIPPNSPFLVSAAEATATGSPYYANLTITLTPSSGSNTVTVTTNSAELRVHPDPDGYLSLDAVPDFDFGLIDPTQIYQGNTQLSDTEKPTSVNLTNHLLSITDTRTLGRNWQLQAQLAPFVDIDSQILDNVALQITGLAANPVTLKDDDQWVPITDATTSAPTTYAPKATLTFQPSPDTHLYQGQIFKSNITWNLITDTPDAPAL